MSYKLHIRLNELQCRWIPVCASDPFQTSSPSPCVILAALEPPPLDVMRHYLSLLAIVCQMQSCWSRWRTLGRCHRRCQTWTHLQDKPMLMFTCCHFLYSPLLRPAGGDSMQNVSMHQCKCIQSLRSLRLVEAH